jgi:hypothetical protein
MRGVGRHRFQCLGNHLLNLPIRDLAWCTNPRLVQKTIHSIFAKPFAPLADCGTGDVQFAGNFGVSHFFPARKDDLYLIDYRTVFGADFATATAWSLTDANATCPESVTTPFVELNSDIGNAR